MQLPSEWIISALSVEPPIYEMASNDIETFGFNAEGPVTAVVASAIDITDPRHLISAADIIVAADLNITSDGANVTVTNGIRGHFYEVRVQFQNADNREWSRVLVVSMVSGPVS